MRKTNAIKVRSAIKAGGLTGLALANHSRKILG